MKSKTALTLLAFAAAPVTAFLLRIYVFKRSDTILTPKTVTPVSSSAQERSNLERTSSQDGAAPTTFVPLLAAETLISTASFDFDGDGLDDQIAAVRKSGYTNIFLVAGLYNPSLNSYIRAAEIATEIVKTRTFSYTGIDMTGDHRMALVYQGEKRDGGSALALYHCRKSGGKIEVVSIGSFSSDGTIFIQQTERSESYELSQTKGESFAVWVYSSDRRSADSAENSSVNQIQTEYRWSEREQKYIQSKRLNITGSSLAAKELSRIQNGNLETFAKFLTGLWYKTSAISGAPRYIHFNYDTKEVIFLSEDTEGVYSWEDGNLRRGGMYLTAVNTIIPSIKRRFDIGLSGVNEVRILVHDNVGMIIKENNQWDGIYRKLSFQTTFGEAKAESFSDTVKKELLTGPAWTDGSGNRFEFSGKTFKVSGRAESSGVFITDDVGGFAVIQFRFPSEQSALGEAYSMSFLPKAASTSLPASAPAGTQSGRTDANAAFDTNTVVLSPVRLAPDTCYPADGYRITLTRE
ncbi:MAG: pallilysin-related adhesin [Treponema sp.]